MEAQNKKKIIADRLCRDPYAPSYHFIAPEGNADPFDPNGAIYWNGQYHLFYICQDDSLPMSGHSWGHASSRDLLHWTYHPTALAPHKEDPEAGIFSGCAFVNKDGIPTLIYHGLHCGTCIATAEDDDLIQWKKSPHNPVIPEPREGDPGWGVYNVFDPHAWIEGDTYYVILGGRVKPDDIRDTAYLFQSKDLVHWEYLRQFYNPRSEWTEPVEDCACPDFFKLGDRYVLSCISHAYGARYYLGQYENATYLPEEHHRMNWPGGPCFAPESLIDDDGRRVYWAWVLDQRKDTNRLTSNLGVMTMPRVLTLDSKGALLVHPPDEVESLRRNPRSVNALTVSGEKEIEIDDIKGDCTELALEAEISKGGVFGINVRMSPDGEEHTAIIVDASAHTLSIDTTQSSLSPDVYQASPLFRVEVREDVRVQTAPFRLESGERLRLRVFIDRSILEVFASGRQCVTQRIYPTRSDSLGVAVFSRSGTTKVLSLNAWDIAATNTLEQEVEI